MASIKQSSPQIYDEYDKAFFAVLESELLKLKWEKKDEDQYVFTKSFDGKVEHRIQFLVDCCFDFSVRLAGTENWISLPSQDLLVGRRARTPLKCKAKKINDFAKEFDYYGQPANDASEIEFRSYAERLAVIPAFPAIQIGISFG